MKKLINTLALTHRHCLSIRMMCRVKPSEEKSPEYELSVSVIPVDESKKKEKTLALSSALAECVVDGKFQIMV